MSADTAMHLIAPLRQFGGDQFSSVRGFATQFRRGMDLPAQSDEALQFGVAQR